MAYLEYFGIALIIVHTISILFITKIPMAKRLFLAGWIAMMVIGVPVIYNYLPFWAFALLCLSGLGIYVFLLLFQNDPDIRRSRNSASRRKYSGAAEKPSRRYLEEQQKDEEIPTTFARREQSSSLRPVVEEANDTVLKAQDFSIDESGLDEQPVYSTEQVVEKADMQQQEISRVYTHETVTQTEDFEVANVPTEELASVAEETQEELVYTDFVMTTDPITFEEQDDKKTKAIKYALQVDAMLENDEQTEFIIPRVQVVKGHQAMEVEASNSIQAASDEVNVNTFIEEVEAHNQQAASSELASTVHDSTSDDIVTSEDVAPEILEPLIEERVEKRFEEEIVEQDVDKTEVLVDVAQETEGVAVANDVVSLEQLFATTEMDITETSEATISTNEESSYEKLEDLFEPSTTETPSSATVVLDDVESVATELEPATDSSINEVKDWAQPLEATTMFESVNGLHGEINQFATDAVEEHREENNDETEPVVENPVAQEGFALTPLDAETVEVIKVKIANDGPLSVEEQLDREFYFQFIMYEIKELVSLGMYQQTVDYLKEILIDSYDKNLRREALDLLEMVKIDMYDPKVNERIKKEYQQIKERNTL